MIRRLYLTRGLRRRKRDHVWYRRPHRPGRPGRWEVPGWREWRRVVAYED